MVGNFVTAGTDLWMARCVFIKRPVIMKNGQEQARP